jgi:hypothetical protein
MLFLLAAGLTLVFGIMDMINLAHGSLYMVGAFFAPRRRRPPIRSGSVWGRGGWDGRSRHVLELDAAAHAVPRATTCRRCWPPSR